MSWFWIAFWTIFFFGGLGASFVIALRIYPGSK